MTQKPSCPKICAYVPSYHELKANKRYLWCSCGLSKTAPFCDGSHAGTDFKPVMVKGESDGQEALFCECKHTKTPPFCDGTHANLEGGYQQDDPESPTNLAIAQVDDESDAVTNLDNGCVVVRPSNLAKKTRGNLSWCSIITAKDGAEHQAQFFCEISKGASPTLLSANVETVVFVGSGEGVITIAGQDRGFKPLSGLYIRPNEAFSFKNESDTPIRLYLTQCPGTQVTSLVFADDEDKSGQQFDAAYPDRIALMDHHARHAMGERYWQLLVEERHGANMITQFVGHIPPSKAMPHRHLYEETLIFQTGAGMVWTLSQKTPVKAGDVLFLPRKQWHSVQSFGPDGMMVVGVIYPGNNPGINY